MPSLTLVCQQCSESFVPKRPWATFCSDPCRMAAWAQKHPRASLGVIDLGKARKVAGVERMPQGGANAVLALSELEGLKARVELLEARPLVLGRSSGADPTKWKHGANAYRNHGCRCVICVEGMKAGRRKRRTNPSV